MMLLFYCCQFDIKKACYKANPYKQLKPVSRQALTKLC